MADDNDLRINFDMPDHDKIQDLNDLVLKPLLRPDVILAGGGPFDCFIRLLAWVGRHRENREDGILRNMSPDKIERRAHWTGPPGTFFEALKSLRLIEMHSGHWSIHDWEEHQRWLRKANDRREIGIKAAAVRYAKQHEGVDSELLKLGIDPQSVLSRKQKDSHVQDSQDSKGVGCYPQTLAKIDSQGPDGLLKGRAAPPTVPDTEKHDSQLQDSQGRGGLLKVPAAMNRAMLGALPDAVPDAVPNSIRVQSSSVNSSQSPPPMSRAAPQSRGPATATTANILKNESDRIMHGILRGYYREDAEILRVLSYCRKWLDASDAIWLRRLVACAMIGVRKKPRCLALYLQACIKRFDQDRSEPNELYLSQAEALIREQQGLNEIQRPAKRSMEKPMTMAEYLTGKL